MYQGSPRIRSMQYQKLHYQPRFRLLFLAFPLRFARNQPAVRLTTSMPVADGLRTLITRTTTHRSCMDSYLKLHAVQPRHHWPHGLTRSPRDLQPHAVLYMARFSSLLIDPKTLLNPSMYV